MFFLKKYKLIHSQEDAEEKKTHRQNGETH